MKKPIKFILVSLTAVLLFASMLQVCFQWPEFSPLKGVIAKQAMPELSLSSYSNGSYQQQTEQYLKQHFGFREPLIRSYNQYLWDVFRKSPVEGDQILFGKDGWIYGAEAVADYYQKLYLYYAVDSADMAQKLSREAQQILQLQQVLESHGVHLFVCLAPSKDLVYPEYLPEDPDPRHNDEPKISARFFNEEEYTRLGVNHLNLEQYFLSIKDTVDRTLFPQTGEHWTKYASLFAADTLIRYMEHLGGINMKNLVIGSRTLDNAREPDDDLEQLMNLIRPLPKPQYWYAETSTDGDTTAVKPKVIVVGDSFWWNLAIQLPLYEIFSEIPYWYYNSTVHYYPPYNSVSELDIKEELLSADFVILSYCATQQYRRNDGFTQEALLALGCKSDDPVMDSIAFIEREVQHAIANIINTPEWMDLIREKAKNNGNSVEQTLREDAVWIVNNKIEQGILTWKKESDTIPELDNHGIQ